MAICLAALVLLLPALSGCLHTVHVPRLPPTYSIDELRYWFEGDLLVVNVTFTNIANFTAGESTLDPEMVVYANEARGGELNYIGDPVFYDGANHHFTLIFHLQLQGDWERRWYDKETSTQLGLKRTFSGVGPVRIDPGQSLTVEFGFLMKHNLTDGQGYYTIMVEMPSFYPTRLSRDNNAEDAHYNTGCFNHDTPEFYGIKGDRGCPAWNCQGESTHTEYTRYKVNGKPKPEYIPECNLTGAVGPYYDG